MKRYTVIVVFICFGFSTAGAQWQLVFPNFVPPLQSINHCGGIFYTQGMLWVSGGGQFPSTSFYSSSDSGLSWSVHTINQSFTISDIDFFDRNNGVLTAGGLSGVFITNDGGLNWKFSFIGKDIIGVKNVGWKDNIVGTVWTLSVHSTDGGTSWQTISQVTSSASLGVTINSSIFMGHNPVMMSSDFGSTWIPKRGSYDEDSYSIAIGKTCTDSTIYVATENFGVARKPSRIGQFKASSNGGDSFTNIVTKPIGYISGAVTTSKHAAFCPTLNDGIYRTTDRGRTWMSIGGPGVQNDSRSIVAINDNVLLVLDSNGNLWKTTNCGGFPIKRPPVERPVISGINIYGVLSCDSIVISPKIAQSYCQSLFITNVTLEGNDLSYFRFLTAPKLPDTLRDGQTRSFQLSFFPAGNVRTFSVKVHIKGRYIFEDDTLALDTLINCTISTKILNQIVEASRYTFIYDTLSTCFDFQDSVVKFTNTGCDTLTLISGPGRLSPEFSIVGTFQTPIKIPKDSSLSVIFRFKPYSNGRFTSYPAFIFMQRSKLQQVDLFLEGYGSDKPGNILHSPDHFLLSSLSICSRDSASGFITKTGCDTASIDPLSYIGDNDFKTLSPQTIIRITSGDTIRYKIYLNPARKGIRQGQIILASHVASVTTYDTIPITVTVTDGTRILNSSATALNFGKTNLCDERDSVFTLKNTGCDTLVISTVDLQGSGFTSDAQTPIVLLPGQSQDITIKTKIDTANGKTNNSAVISFTTDADNTISPITLDRTFSYPKSFSVGLTTDSLTATAGSAVVVSITGGLGLGQPNSGVNTLDVDLTLNEDLLGYIKSISPNTITKTGKHLTITGNPELQSLPNGSLADIYYEVFLTKDSATDITLSNLKLNGGDNTNCAPKITNTNSSFTYRYECGDKTLQRYLKGEAPIKIISLRPNPAKNEVTIDYATKTNDNCTIEVIDILGNVISQRTISPKTNQQLTLPVSQLSNGSYIIRLTQNQNTISARFVKEQ